VRAWSTGEVYADGAYAADRFTSVIRARGGVASVVDPSTWGGPAALARLEAWNAAVRSVRCRIEKVFGTSKRGMPSIFCIAHDVDRPKQLSSLNCVC
jgi:hypothetical protein